MFTELGYVKEQLKRIGHAGWQDVFRGTGVPIRTIKRIAYDETKAPGSDTIGKIAIFFRTREKRRRDA